MYNTLSILVTLFFSGVVYGQCCDLARPDAHAPLAVMGDHLHKKNELMLGAHFHLMNMNHAGHQHSGSSSGTNMQMYMLEAMWGVSTNVTAMLMVPYLRTTTRSGTSQVATDTKVTLGGIGDIGLSGLVNLLRTTRTATHLNVGISLPTGSINRTERTTYGTLKVPYMMQAGSGTFDGIVGITSLYQRPKWSGGGQFMANLRTYNNKNNYRLGNHFTTNLWASYKWTSTLSTSLRTEWHYQTAMVGQDIAIDPETIIPAGQHIGVALGINYYFAKGGFKGNRLAVEAHYPLYYTKELAAQRINWEAEGGWQKTYKLR